MYKLMLSLLFFVSAFATAQADIFQADLNQEVNSKSVQHWNDSNFTNAIAQGVVVVDFYADWCPPCRKFSSVFESVAEQLEGSATFGKVNVDSGRRVVNEYQVSNIPTVVIFRDGKEIKRRTGGADDATFRAWVESAL